SRRDPPSFPTRRSSDLHAIIDYTSGYLYAKPVTAFNGIKVVKTTQTWCHRFGYPQWINCDNAEYFISGLFATWAKKHHIQLNGRSEEHTSELQSRFDLV